jgi:hypothetical protein
MMTQTTLNELADRIAAYLQRFEADPAINVETAVAVADGRGTRRMRPYYKSTCYVERARVIVIYRSFSGPWKLTAAEATAYLAALDAGFVGWHTKA